MYGFILLEEKYKNKKKNEITLNSLYKGKKIQLKKNNEKKCEF